MVCDSELFHQLFISLLASRTFTSISSDGKRFPCAGVISANVKPQGAFEVFSAHIYYI